MRAAPDPRCRAWRHQSLASVFSDVRSDIGRYLTKSPENVAGGQGPRKVLGAMLTPQIQCTTLYRLSHFLHANGWRGLARLLGWINFVVHKASIAPSSCIGPGFHLPHPAATAFHGRAGRGLTLYGTAMCLTWGPAGVGPPELGPELGDDVTLGAAATIVGPVRIGDGCRISFHTPVAEDLPAQSRVLSRMARGTTDRRL